MPPLAKAAFGDTYLNARYQPWEGPDTPDFDELSPDKVERVSTRPKLTIDEHMRAASRPPSENIVRMQEMLETIAGASAP